MAKGTEEKTPSEGAKRPSVEAFSWERQPDESFPAFSRFLTYRDLPPNERSLRQTAKLCEISEQLVSRWSKRHCWVKRALTYDGWLLELSDGLSKHAVLSHRTRLVRLASVSLDKAQSGIAKLDETKLDVSELSELTQVSIKAGQQAFGEPDKRPASGPSVIVQTQVGYGEARPSWLERSETKASETEPEVVVQVEEKVLERRQTGGPRTVQTVGKQPRGKLKQLVLSAPVRVEDP